MLDTFPVDASEPELVLMPVSMTGDGSSGAPTLKNGRSNFTFGRSGVGALSISFNDDPGNFIGIAGFCFGDATPGNVDGWTVVEKAFTAPSGGTDASLTFQVYNDTPAAADIAATSHLTLLLAFKRAPQTE